MDHAVSHCLIIWILQIIETQLDTWLSFNIGYTPGTPYKVSCSPTSGTVPPYSSSPNPYQTAVYPVRSAYPQQNPYAQVKRVLWVNYITSGTVVIF